MADQVELIQTSKEEVAYKLYREITGAEDRPIGREEVRKYLLDTYAECLHATRGLRDWKGR
ncbi:MAG: hypothetical protein KDA53_08585 [Hyphomonas sp.]|nr:hypothetical protein [Hyphomonas sp.]